MIAALLILLFSANAFWYLRTGTASPLRRFTASALAPIERGVAVLFERAGEIVQSAAAYRELEAENDRLRSLLAEAETELARTASLREENDELRGLLGMRRRYSDCTFTPARVLSVSDRGRLMLDCGEAGGASVGDAVVVREGMVGTIVEVGADWSEMITVLDADFRAAAVLPRCREACVAEGDMRLSREGVLSLVWLPQESDAIPGDRVITSGQGGLFPQGLALGSVFGLRRADDGLSCEAELRPAADLTALDSVWIVTAFREVG